MRRFDHAYLGLDQALANTGWCLACVNGSKIYLRTGIIQTKPSSLLVERLFLIERSVASLIEQFNPERVCTEAIYFDRRGAGNGKVLIQVEITLHNYLYRLGIPYSVIPSQRRIKESWRHILRLEGHKAAAREYFQAVIGVRLKEHEADAAAITLAGLSADGLLADNREVVYDSSLLNV